MAARWAAGALALAAAAGCSRPEAPVAAPAPLTARAEWLVECRVVMDQRHQACYGPGWDAQRARAPGRFHFYQVSVERLQAADAPLVLFAKRLEPGAVDARLLREPPGDGVASYDAAQRAVRFAVGGEAILFPLDPRR